MFFIASKIVEVKEIYMFCFHWVTVTSSSIPGVQGLLIKMTFVVVPCTVVTTSAPRESSMIAEAMAVAVMSTSASTSPPPVILLTALPTTSAKGLVTDVFVWNKLQLAAVHCTEIIWSTK